MSVKRKRKRAKKIDEGDGEIRKKRKKGEDKDKRVQSTIDQLTTKHDKTYTPMQYRVWAEMYLGGVHSSLDTAPTSTMFNRAGGDCSVKRKTGHTSEVVTAISNLISALSPRLVPSNSGSITVSSPAKMIDNCTIYYKQLADLKSLFGNSVLSGRV